MTKIRTSETATGRSQRETPRSGGESLGRLLAQLPEDPVRRGRAFERLCKWLLENNPVYQGRLARVWSWDRWPGRWSADAGIDLVAQEKNGSLWAIQAKAYSPEYPIKKGDVDTFLSESSRPQFSYRLLIATTDRIGPTARRTLDGQQIPVGTLLRGELQAAPVTWPASLEDLRPRAPRKKSPRPHQKKAIRDVIKGLRGKDRGQLIMACGTGKTLTSLFIAEELGAKRILFLVPSLSLLSQVILEWTASSATPLDYMAVCSDESVVSEDELVSSTSELPFPVTTAPHEIAAFLSARGKAPRVVFSTYQSSERVAEAMKSARVPAFDLAIADEAHRLVGRPERGFATILRGSDIRSAKRLFMTATPRRFTGRVIEMARDSDLEIASMDDEEIFGPRLHTLTFGEAITHGLLTDYRVAVVGIDDSVYLEWAERGVLVRGEGLSDIDARTLAGHIGLAKAVRDFDLRRAISFHGRVKGAKTFAAVHPEVLRWLPARQRPSGTIHADYISGDMSASERRLKLEALRDLVDERALLTNARCLTEGIDVPSLDAVAFVDPRRSAVDIVQAVGRAIRLSDEKTAGTIVVPVFLGRGDDADAALNGSPFKPVWDVLNALRAHDEDFALELDSIRREMGRQTRAQVRLPSKLHLDLPRWVNSDFSRAIRVQLVEQTTSTWDFWLGLLKAFAAREGHARPLQDHLERGYQLGTWVQTQRDRRERLSPERQQLLEATAGWSWDPYADDWERAFALLMDFTAREGHARVPSSHKEGGFPLGSWVSTQRTRRSTTLASRCERLEGLPGWTWDALSDKWERAYGLLRSFVEREGHARVPAGHLEGEFPLGRWVTKQRSKQGRMSEERRRRLEAVPGWRWATRGPRSTAWEESFALLMDFAAREGHARVPRSCRVDGFALGDWVTNQRVKRDSMPADRRRLLETVPGWTWNSISARWEEGYDLLKTFSAREGHARVPLDHEEGAFPLGGWVRTQRAQRNKLSLERRKRLEQVRGWEWTPYDSDWERAYALLLDFAAKEGHARVPQLHRVGDVRLGSWVATQRRRRASLSDDRLRRLEKVPGWVWSPQEHAWEQGFASLQAFVGREGHALVPAKHREGEFGLGIWVGTQRRKQLTMDLEHRRRLEAVKGWKWRAR